jgi:Tol biopolymer transport system component
MLRLEQAPPTPRPIMRIKETVPLVDFSPRVSISADGSRVAFRTSVSPLIQVRSLDEFAATGIAGTEDALPVAPGCFSPDNRWLAYSAAKALKKISLASGAALTLAELNSSDADGASGQRASCDWANDGNIYLAASPGIMRVSENGGPLEVVVPVVEADPPTYLSPQLLPDGTHVLFTSIGASNVASAVVADLGTQERKIVADGVGLATFVPRRLSKDGYLVYGLNGALFATPFDLSRLEAGVPRPVESGVMGISIAASAAISSSGTLAYYSSQSAGGVAGDTILTVVRRDGTERELPEPPKVFGEVTLAPDGRRAAVTLTDGRTSVDLWIYDLDGQRLSRLTFQGANLGAAWTPDGKRLIYFHAETIGVPEGGELRSIVADGGSAPTTVLIHQSWMRGFLAVGAVSADGKTLLVTNDSQGSKDIWLVPLDVAANATRAFIATPFNERDPDLSPDGRFVAYSSDESGQDEVYVVPFSGSGGKTQVSSGRGSLPRWDLSGRELYYVTDGKVMSVVIDTTSGVRALAPRSLLDTPPFTIVNRGFPYSVFPDGEHFLWLKRSQDRQSQTAELRVITNWVDELERTATVGRR